ncbi:DUF802 domain-containing protein [Variovorax sp. PAMC 28711]|uniref:DUF802 domain-containing protein n=1 Tax=Variovorax sp. PAMC 28711 TaxID=1795631 RepID=UPI00078E7D1A|nr:DUF802 domain-containing protein [Variovorax sp. PAMC 28711]AMM24273.1 hypothetical protein AX767_07870 [Variovorax sp. PAMC 28711]
MTRSLTRSPRTPITAIAAFGVGLVAIGWVAFGYLGTHTLALAMTLLIGAFYVVGALELRRFHDATSTLTRAVTDLPETPTTLGAWLDRLHPSLRNAVRLRIEGERVGLPGPALTPYLTGLLVLLGMLGTFLGMVVTLNGTGTALESASDLLAIRSSLAAPVKGLGLAFGTSLAGVAASAMLGLVSALCRRDRLQAAQSLDTRIATTLRPFTSAHRREESFKLLQQQGEAMPVLLDRLQTMMSAMERQHQALNERLLASQDAFHGKAEAAYTGLANSVGRSLTESLTESARLAGAAIQPVVEATMAGIARETAGLHDTIGAGVQRQLDGMSTRLEATTTTVADLWKTALAGHERTSKTLSSDLRASLDRFNTTFDQRATALVDGVAERLAHTTASLSGTVSRAHVDLQTQLAANDQQRLAAWTGALEAMADALGKEWREAGTHAASRQEDIARTLANTASEITAQSETHAKNTIAEIAQLMQAASEAPRAAAEVIAELRQKLSDSMVRDNAMLDERARILGTLETLLDAVNHASTAQRAAIDSLVGASAELLERVGTRFTDQVEAETGKMAGVAAQLTGSAVEVASLGEAFGAAVDLFSQSNDKLGAQLQRIEGALGQSMTRSDEQLAYYVAQAREVIDLSLMSQKQIVEDLQRIASQRALAGSDA